MKKDLSAFDSKYNMISDFDYILRFSQTYKIDFLKETLAVYNQHQDQLQLKNLFTQATQFNEWFEIKVIKQKVFVTNMPLIII